ncbi:Vitellogenin [Bagarius yarrelli]|uniref:Vitellogenin n=1 Tax=Bagarius yarrelli TaxID=175774 RepID=A0A556U5L3_BAGYA|nr:Vitellogenin [Bagarius yarrelli]
MTRGSLRYELATEILQKPIQLIKINNAQAQTMDFGCTSCCGYRNEKFQADELAMPEFTQVLFTALHMTTASPDAIHLIANLALNPKIKSIPIVREVTVLGYGSMIAKYCAEVPTCSADLLKPVHEIAAEAITRGDIPKMTLALKALGNAGHPASLKTIMKLLPGFGSAAAAFPIKVQIDAILALRNIAKKEPKLVQPVALQLFMDRALHPELRMVACIVLFETKPSAALMTTVSAPFMVGAAGTAYLINDAVTALPRARAYLAGAAADVLEVGVTADGLNDVLRKSYAADETADRFTKIKCTMKAIAHGPNPREFLKEAVKALQKGIAFQYAKPLLAAEVAGCVAFCPVLLVCQWSSVITLLLLLLQLSMTTLSKQAVPLPIALPIEQDGTIPALRDLDIRAIVEKWLNEFRNK